MRFFHINKTNCRYKKVLLGEDMKNLFSIIALLLCCGAGLAEHDHFSDKQIGEFYEFDLVGTRGDQVRRAVTYHTKQVIKAPFQAVGFCFHTASAAVSHTLKEIELFLSDSRSLTGKRRQIKEALGEWAVDPIVEGYLIEHDRDAGTNCFLGIPSAALKLLKNSLYTVGIALPRGTWRTIKSFARGTCDCARI